MSTGRWLAIGDIHGSISALRALLKRLEPEEDDTLVFLGDYIDRGENSRAVLDFLLDLERRHRCIFLKGNHEDMFLQACKGDPDDWLLWMANGGLTTLRDFGGMLPPDRYINWLERLEENIVESETHYFVHAGLAPNVPAAESSLRDRLWMREPFLSSDYNWGKRVVFGHTIHLAGPLVRPNKIGIDTGACIPRLGRLTCLVLPEERFVFSKGRGRRLASSRSGQ